MRSRLASVILATGCAGQSSGELEASLEQCDGVAALDEAACTQAVAVTAAQTESAAVAIEVGVTYEVARPGPGARGYVVFTPTVSGTYTLYSSDDPARVCDIEPLCRSTALACDDLDRAARYDVVAGLPYVIELQHATTTLRIGAPATPGLPFDPPRTYTAGTTPYGLNIGDLDGDGAPDLLVSTPDDASGMTTVDILANSGGDFTMVEQLATSAPAETAIADYNADGLADFAVIGVDGQGPLPGGYFIGQGDFAFGRVPGPSGFDFRGDLTAADFDEDGTPELVASYSDTTTLDGPGGFVILDVPAFTPTNNEPAFGRDTTWAGAGDFDGDGHQDVVVASSADGTLKLYRGDGSGLVAFATQHATPGLGIRKLLAANIDGDDATDVVSIHFDSTVVVTTGMATDQALVRSVTAFDVAAGDLDGDGLADLAVTGATDDGAGGVAVYFNRPGGFTLAGVLPMPGTSRGVVIGDVDGDGKNDIAATTFGSVLVFRGR